MLLEQMYGNVIILNAKPSKQKISQQYKRIDVLAIIERDSMRHTCNLAKGLIY